MVHSFLYYQCDCSVLEDSQFDMLCKHLYENWNKITHPHKYLLTKESLAAGSGFSIAYKKYPTIVKVMTNLLQRRLNEC